MLSRSRSVSCTITFFMESELCFSGNEAIMCYPDAVHLGKGAAAHDGFIATHFYQNQKMSLRALVDLTKDNAFFD
jgi:hypothetical protein